MVKTLAVIFNLSDLVCDMCMVSLLSKNMITREFFLFQPCFPDLGKFQCLCRKYYARHGYYMYQDHYCQQTNQLALLTPGLSTHQLTLRKYVCYLADVIYIYKHYIGKPK
jgi:hypothetical protein